MIFKTIGGKPVDLLQYTLDRVKECPLLDVYIGTDSQVYSTKIGDKVTNVFVTVIAYRFGSKGVNFVYSKSAKFGRMGKYNRLYMEGEVSINTAKKFRELVNLPIQIDLDYNSDSKYYSNRLVSVIGSWAVSLGFKVNVKPDLQVATRAADYCCKNL